MSIKATYVEGVFKPIEDVKGAIPGKIYELFSEEELRDLNEDLRWLKLAEKSFEFWDNDEDAVYDNL